MDAAASTRSASQDREESSEDLSEEDAAWTIEETEEMVHQMRKYAKSGEKIDWVVVAASIGKKTPSQCRTWYKYLFHIDSSFRAKIDPQIRRQRKKAADVERKFPCYVPGCTRSYGSERALRQHFQLKHKDYAFDKYAVNLDRYGQNAGSKDSSSSSPQRPSSPVPLQVSNSVVNSEETPLNSSAGLRSASGAQGGTHASTGAVGQPSPWLSGAPMQHPHVVYSRPSPQMHGALANVSAGFRYATPYASHFRPYGPGGAPVPLYSGELPFPAAQNQLQLQGTPSSSQGNNSMLNHMAHTGAPISPLAMGLSPLGQMPNSPQLYALSPGGQALPLPPYQLLGQPQFYQTSNSSSSPSYSPQIRREQSNAPPAQPPKSSSM